MNNRIKRDVEKLFELHKAGKLGGEKMPEDENPLLDIHSRRIIYTSRFLWH